MTRSPSPASTCSPAHRRFWRLALTVLATTVVCYGFAYALFGYPRAWRPWPWGSWAMFIFDHDYLSRLHATGVLEDGRQIPLDLERWFRYQVTFERKRYAEVYLRPGGVTRLATYVCRRYNTEAAPGQRLSSLTLWNVFWSRTRGRLRRLEDVPLAERTTQIYLQDYRCDAATER